MRLLNVLLVVVVVVVVVVTVVVVVAVVVFQMGGLRNSELSAPYYLELICQMVRYTILC